MKVSLNAYNQDISKEHAALIATERSKLLPLLPLQRALHSNEYYISLFIHSNFILCWYLQQKQTKCDLYNSLYANSYTNGSQSTDMYANLRQPKMGKINCLKTKYKVKNINTKTRRKPSHSSQHF